MIIFVGMLRLRSNIIIHVVTISSKWVINISIAAERNNIVNMAAGNAGISEYSKKLYTNDDTGLNTLWSSSCMIAYRFWLLR